MTSPSSRRYAGRVFLGEDLLPYLVLAMGAALAVGNLLALVVPRQPPAPVDARAADADADGPADPRQLDSGGELERPPLMRSVLMIAVGSLAAVWAVASLLS